MHLLAHGLADLIRTVGDPAHLETVPARRRDAATRGDDPRTFERAALDRPAQLDDHRTIRAEIADGGDTGTQRGARVAEGLERRQGVALLHLRGEVRIAVEREMAVAVDEPGHHESARCTRDLAPFIWRRPRDLAAVAGPDDLGTVDDDRRVLDHALSVEEPVDLEDRSHRDAVSSGDARRAHRASSRARFRAARLRRWRGPQCRGDGARPPWGARRHRSAAA